MPTAALRFGDAEARLLTVEPDDEVAMREVLDKIQQETGLRLAPASVLELKSLMCYAFDRADVIGIGFDERSPSEHKMWLGKLAALYDEHRAADSAVLAHCVFSHHIRDALPEMLAQRRVSAISCRDLKPVLEDEWGLDDVAVYQVPSQYVRRDVDGAYESKMHDVPIWPDAHARVSAELRVREPGEVFLVGAGLFGKDLAIRVREQGGIALDMGSALDRIAGKVTRGPERRALDFYASGESVPEIAAQFRRLFGVDVEPKRISRAIADNATVELRDWCQRPLEQSYSIVYLTALRTELYSGGEARNCTCHIAIGLTPDDVREPLGIWWREGDWPATSQTMLGDLRRRGVREVGAICTEEAEWVRNPTASAFPTATARTESDPANTAEAIRAAIAAHGRFADAEAAATLVYLALKRAEARRRKAPSSARSADRVRSGK